jgi:hypothetical protein
MVAASLFFEFSKYCPQPSCGEPLQTGPRFCAQCGAGIINCHSCRSTNRLLALHCRACGEDLAAEVWPMHAGLKAGCLSFNTIHSIEDMRPPTPHRLSARLLAPLIAADGVIVASLNNGSIALLDEARQGEIGRLQVPEPIAVTPAIDRGFLYVAAGKHIFAFDLPRYLDQQSKLDFRPAWSFAAEGSSIFQPLLIDKRAAYLVSQDGGRAILDAISSDGSGRAWTEPVRLDTYRVTPPVLVRDQLLIATAEGEVSVIDPIEGRVLDRFSIGRRVDLQVTPFVTGNQLLLVDTDNNVLELQVTGGRPLTSVLYGHRARITSLAASNDYIAIGHMAGLTLLTSRGRPKWSNDSMEPILVAPIIAGDSVFAIDSSGTGLLFDALRSNPKARVRLLSGEINTPPILTRSKIMAANGSGEVVAIAWS